MKKITDKERLTVLLEIIRGGKGYVPASWVNERGAMTGVNIRTRRDIDVCISAISASRRSREDKSK